jgi:hypothetical protein
MASGSTDATRVEHLAATAAELARAAGVDLPTGLRLVELAGDGRVVGATDPSRRTGGRAAVPVALPGAEPVGRPASRGEAAAALIAALEAELSPGERQRGAHYTPADVAQQVAALALGRPMRGLECAPVVVDPACGGGSLLLAVADRLAEQGIGRAVIARDLLFGADVDPRAVAVAETAIALWSGGTAPAAGHLVVADALDPGGAPWQRTEGFDVVVGNPPFQGQLARATARPPDEVGRLRRRFGAAVTPYVDTAALFLLAAADLARPGGRVVMIQPQSTVAARDAAAVRSALAERAHLVDLWQPAGQAFAAHVHVCVAVLDVLASGERSGDGPDSWSERLADARGVPAVELRGGRTLADVADLVAGFREEYYALVPHVHEGRVGDRAPLVTSGLVDVGAVLWGERAARFAKRRWDRPVVDVAAVRGTSRRLDAWLTRVLRPKVVVASQTAVVEAAADRTGTAVPVTPVVSVVPTGDVPEVDVDLVTALLCAPPVSAWVARRAIGTAMSPGSVRTSAPLLGQVPLPVDLPAWRAAASALAAQDLVRFAATATAMFQLDDDVAADVVAWWHARRPST